MRLRDLDARFVYDATARGSRRSEANTVDGMQGVMFQCPKCALEWIARDGDAARGVENGLGFVRGAHYIRVFFSNPQGAPVAPPDADDNPRWKMAGTSIDDLTLLPSVDLSHDREGRPIDGCKWHGWVTNGEAA